MAWEGWIRLWDIPLYLIPPPSKVFDGLVEYRGLLLKEAQTTALEVVIGFFLSVAVGLPLAVAIASWRWFERCVYPLIVASQVVPQVAIAPLFLIWLGVGIASKIVVVVIISFFPIVINSVIGLRAMEVEKLYLAQSMGASGFDTFLKIRLPNALPNIFGGLKLGATLAVIGAVVGEFVGAMGGLGREVLVANSNLNTVLLFGAVTYLIAMGLTIFSIMSLLERIAIPWHVSQRAQARR
jgi:NitT/TauT family transport system permease protein